MGATDDPAAFRLWAFGTFRVATFVVAFALYLHLTDRLTGLLRSLNTELGLAAFFLLWATTLIATRAGSRHMPDDPSAASMVMTTTVAGAWNGVYVWAALLLVLLVMNVMFGNASGVLILGVVGSIIGSALAFTIGAVFGFAYGIVDAVLFRAVRLLVPGRSLSA